MRENLTTAYSILELAIVSQGQTIQQALHNALTLAQHAEAHGYKRIWFAEHHNSEHIGSTAPVILIGYVANNTDTIRVGSGGVMLPNHSPLIVAEQFGTLAQLYPGRVDLGLGRAPGTDQQTANTIHGAPGEMPGDEHLAVPMKTLPAPALSIRFVQSTTDKLLLVRRQRLRRRRLARRLVAVALLCFAFAFCFTSHFLSLPVREVFVIIDSYKWVCFFCMAATALSQYFDGRLVEHQWRKQMGNVD
ncbi:MAG TPA: MsnO8 family LLM class oxidoreductase [Chitinophagaceae bacterium]|nr:MsnO8 family LLM class oxidoreductase [Chitinophagaceae bacterium]